jgi:hypothetical protein
MFAKYSAVGLMFVHLSAGWPIMRNGTILQARIDQFATSGAVTLGPFPVINPSLSAKPSKHLP